jgi:hypothetical protein
MCVTGIEQIMITSEHIKAAQVRWELQLAILQEEERRIVDALEEHSRHGAPLPREKMNRLKTARAQCNEAFQSLMRSIEDRLTTLPQDEAARRPGTRI